ncbi:YJU2 splicing factor homolog [Agrilus planipennis]|uniref:Splicing factor YJU2 n=1 Tax=Agrilus planipennis TaxID=224129 RepID=A0A1W4X6N2_AGRPL|nr:YJU2 splicing factor homolog [Agrilus planipennis]
MSERKVLNKYYPPDFDPSKIPRMKLPKNRQYTVRLMAPFNMRCATCGEYIYKGKKFNARKEDVENEDYLGIRIYRFYIKCTRCLQEISFKTDPRNTDYEIEAGATRNFMALKLAEEQALREEEEEKEEEQNNPMKLLENRTKQSKNEIDLLESLEELKDLNRRQQAVDYDTMLLQYDSGLSAREREEKLKQLDEEYIKSVKFNSTQKRKLIVEEEVVEEEDETPSSTKHSKVDDTAEEVISTPENIKEVLVKQKSTNTWNKSIGSLSGKGKLKNLVKVTKKNENVGKETKPAITEGSSSSSTQVTTTVINSVKTCSGLSLVGDYSDSGSASD